FRIVRHDAVGAELEQALGFVAIVDDPVIDAQPEAVTFRNERRAIETYRALPGRDLRGIAGERQLAPYHAGQREQRRDLAARQRRLARIAEAAHGDERAELKARERDAVLDAEPANQIEHHVHRVPAFEVDVDLRVGKRDEHLFERRHRDALAGERP